MAGVTLFYQTALWLYVVGALGALFIGFFQKRNALSFALLSFLVASVLLFFAAGVMLYFGLTLNISLGASFPAVLFTLSIDALSAFFILSFALVGIFVSIFALDYVRNETPAGFVVSSALLLNLFFLSIILLISASESLFFLLMWELMTIISWVFVMQHYTDADSRNAGWIYLLMAHIGTAFLMVFFILVSVKAGSTSFSAFPSVLSGLDPRTINLLFFCLLIGFGVKAGIFPLHIWLPKAHPAAPSHISALMSGVMIKTAFYGFLRFAYLYMTLSAWWGFVLLVLGIFTAFMGILCASFTDDIKRVLAYTSIENTGMLLLPLGLAIIFNSYGQTALAVLCVAALLFQIFNHAIFKSLLFMASGLIISVLQTRSLQEMGGLARVMPVTAVLFFCGALSAAGLPPFNGFASKWLIFQNLLYATNLPDVETKTVALLCAAVLGLVSAMTAMVFVRLYTAVFSALPRGQQVLEPQPAIFMHLAMGGAVLVCFLVGVFPFLVLKPALKAAEFCHVKPFLSPQMACGWWGFGFDFASFAPLLLLLFLCLFFLLARKFMLSNPIRVSLPWVCGLSPESGFEFSPSGYSQPFEVVFTKFSCEGLSCWSDFWKQQVQYLHAFSRFAGHLQSGNIRLYLFYILLTIIFLLSWVHL